MIEFATVSTHFTIINDILLLRDIYNFYYGTKNNIQKEEIIMKKKVRIEVGYEFKAGESVQAMGTAETVMDKLFNLCEHRFTSIRVEENIPYDEQRAGLFERRHQIYRALVPEESVEELINLIPEDNPYGIYVKEI